MVLALCSHEKRPRLERSLPDMMRTVFTTVLWAFGFDSYQTQLTLTGSVVFCEVKLLSEEIVSYLCVFFLWCDHDLLLFAHLRWNFYQQHFSLGLLFSLASVRVLKWVPSNRPTWDNDLVLKPMVTWGTTMFPKPPEKDAKGTWYFMGWILGRRKSQAELAMEVKKSDVGHGNDWAKSSTRRVDGQLVRAPGSGSGICYPQAFQARLDGCMRSQNIRTATLVNKDWCFVYCICPLLMLILRDSLFEMEDPRGTCWSIRKFFEDHWIPFVGWSQVWDTLNWEVQIHFWGSVFRQ